MTSSSLTLRRAVENVFLKGRGLTREKALTIRVIELHPWKSLFATG